MKMFKKSLAVILAAVMTTSFCAVNVSAGTVDYPVLLKAATSKTSDKKTTKYEYKCVKETTDYSSSKSTDNSVDYTYNSNGQLIKEQYSLGYYYEYKYDKKGRLTSKIYCNAKAPVEKTVTYKYNSDGSYTKKDVNGKNTREYTFNADGTLYKYKDKSGNTEHITVYYNNGQIKENKYFKNGTENKDLSETYNEYGVLIAHGKNNKIKVSDNIVTETYSDNSYREATIDKKKRTATERIYQNGKLCSECIKEFYPSGRIRKSDFYNFTYNSRLIYEYADAFKEESANSETLYLATITYDNNNSEKLKEEMIYSKDGKSCDQNSVVPTKKGVIVEKRHDDFEKNSVSHKKDNKDTGEVLVETKIVKKNGSVFYKIYDYENKTLSIIEVDKNGNKVKEESGLDLDGKQTKSYEVTTLEYKKFKV